MRRFFLAAFLVCIAATTSHTSHAECIKYWNSNQTVPTGFASAYNVFHTTSPLISVSCNSAPSVSVTIGDIDGNSTDAPILVYNTAYYSTDGSTWTAFTLSPQHSSFGSWSYTTATGTITLTSTDLQHWNFIAFVVAYYFNNSWHIGCANATCASAVGWNLEAIGDPGPGEPISIACSPSDIDLESGTASGTTISTCTVTTSDGAAYSGTIDIIGASFLSMSGNSVITNRDVVDGDIATFDVTISAPIP